MNIERETVFKNGKVQKRIVIDGKEFYFDIDTIEVGLGLAIGTFLGIGVLLYLAGWKLVDLIADFLL